VRLLLDTHVFIWWDDDYKRLPENVLAALLSADNTLYLSLASIWEMQIKIQLGKLRFDLPLAEKVRDQQQKNALQLLSITADHIYALEALPYHHRDPFDRLLIAQASQDGLQLITHDANIKKYSIKTFWDEQ